MMLFGRAIRSAARDVTILAAFAIVAAASGPARADEPIEIFDAHMH